MQKNPLELSRAFPAKHHSSHMLAVAAFGNSLRGDDGVASYLLERLSARLEAICTLDAGSHTSALPAFLNEHKIGIIIDSVTGTNGEMVKLDLSNLKLGQTNIDCSHGLSWLDEIILYEGKFSIPRELYFIGIPSYETSWQIGLSERLLERLPQFETELGGMIEAEMKANA